jgi:rubredoxin
MDSPKDTPKFRYECSVCKTTFEAAIHEPVKTVTTVKPMKGGNAYESVFVCPDCDAKGAA